jgi:3-methyladenine DNA glycosylase AlkD
MAEHEIIKYLKSISDEDIAKVTKTFFKTSKGSYGYGDIFLGIKVAKLRRCVKKFKHTSPQHIEPLLGSKYHEVRHFALLFLVDKFKTKNETQRKIIFDIYIKNTNNINNWDLVDCSAHHIVGSFLNNKSKNILYKLASSKNMWERRIAIVSTLYYIKQGEFEDTLKLAEFLLDDQEDLIHKAVGWMLREVGKKDEKTLTIFLDKHVKQMPRTTLRYSIERLTIIDRNYWLRLFCD